MAKQIAQIAPRRASPAVVQALLIQVQSIEDGVAAGIVQRHLGRSLEEVLATDWVGPISNEQFASIYLACIGVVVGFSARREKRPPMTKEEYDLLCHCVITSTTLRQVIERARSFLLMLGDRGAVVTLEVESGIAEFQLVTKYSKRDSVALFGDLTGLASHYRLFAWLVDLPFELVEVRMCYPQLVSDEVSAFLIPFPITYNAEVNALRFPAHLLDRPVIRSPQELERLLARFPFDVDDTRGPSVLLGERVRTIMITSLSAQGSIATSIDVAATLGISVSTLKRRLKNEHTSYRAIKEALLLTKAVEALEAGNQSIEVLAGCLGFADAVSFRHAFKRWTGYSPSQYLRSRASSRIIAKEDGRITQNFNTAENHVRG